MKAAVEAERTQNIQLASSGTSTAEKGILLSECDPLKKIGGFGIFNHLRIRSCGLRSKIMKI